MRHTGYMAPAVAGCSKAELAKAYFPNSESDETARRNLARWIAMNPELVERLANSGYRKRQHFYTPMQISIIYDVLGEP